MPKAIRMRLSPPTRMLALEIQKWMQVRRQARVQAHRAGECNCRVTLIYGQGRTVFMPLCLEECPTNYGQNIYSTRITIIFIAIAPQSDRNHKFSSDFLWPNCLFNERGIIVVACRHAIASCRHGQWKDVLRHPQKTEMAILQC